MLSTIDDVDQVRAATEEFRALLRTHALRETDVLWGFPNGSRAGLATVVLRAKLHDIYVGMDDERIRAGSYVHLFRLVEQGAEPTPNFSPNAEINVSMTGSRAVGGHFAVNGEQRVLCRRPMFNSYRGRIKEEDALEFFGDYAVPILVGKRERKTLPVIALGTRTFVDDIESFVLRVIALKDHFKAEEGNVEAKDGGPVQGSGTENLWAWNDSAEFEGTKSLDARAATTYEYLHGPLCNRFKGTLETWAKGRFDVRSTKNIDAALVRKSGVARAIFEVKTSGSLSDQLYKAVGQLLYYRWKRGDGDTLLGLVLPAEAKEDSSHTNAFFSENGIQLVYEVAPGRFTFANGTAMESFLEKHCT
ncbi:hypothetical protein G7939_00955 [Ralstonia solanacearum]|uniref:hypothetical protein n=1 Tax=Ralstonia pseudosolanacearum TaxID=1310165 RepID=UPI000B5F4CEF|nr:hypothetical protein [Ralstonia pseudosolanacearum]QIK22114.1 hypothetical protein G7939_00955 [Ralstonia solanacearum]ASL73246.1 hypothetical protein BC350_06080 [Ralstonia pseudosolanacearum]MCK4119562.1 hypothetical protein [Ralstonia pseudosolanacearum]QIK29851.1 hypothetical protein G7947_16870 [Ralstonia solanacearum]QIK34756.1 hypothetical protein G7969_16870 [Ralstonia solanacearum]